MLGVALKPKGAAPIVPDALGVLVLVGLNANEGVVAAGVEPVVDVLELNPKPEVVDAEVDGWVVEGAVGLKLNIPPAAGVLEVVVDEPVPVVELAPKPNPTVVGAEVLGGLSFDMVVIALVNKVLPVCDKAGRAAVVVVVVVEVVDAIG